MGRTTDNGRDTRVKAIDFPLPDTTIPRTRLIASFAAVTTTSKTLHSW